MSLLLPANTEERILAALREGPRRTTALLAALQTSATITKQGFYAALRKLQTEEVVTIYRKNVSLNVAWVKDMARLAREAERNYLPAKSSGPLLELAPGESVSYIFTNLQNLDAFWGHTQSIIVAGTPLTEPVYTYDPHYWFYLARAETEKKIVADIAATGRQFLMTVGSTDALDKVIQPEFASDERQYHLEKLFEKRNYYLVVIGNYVSEGWFDEAVSKDIDAFYRASDTADTVFLARMEELIHRKAHHKMRISHNAQKARRLKAMLGKPFYIKHPKAEN